jgi:hypothetical protein
MSKLTVWIAFIALLIGAYIFDRWRWRARPREQLVEMIQAADWRLHKAAMSQLRRRGEDLGLFLPRFLALLAADSMKERTAAESIIRKFYPNFIQLLQGYSPIADAETCRAKVAQLTALNGSSGHTGDSEA